MNNIYHPSEDDKNDNDIKGKGRNIKRGSDRHVKKLLECHAFVCNSQADAIAIAAQLYQALVETIRKYNIHAENGKENFAEGGTGNNSCRVRDKLDKNNIISIKSLKYISRT